MLTAAASPTHANAALHASTGSIPRASPNISDSRNPSHVLAPSALWWHLSRAEVRFATYARMIPFYAMITAFYALYASLSPQAVSENCWLRWYQTENSSESARKIIGNRARRKMISTMRAIPAKWKMAIIYILAPAEKLGSAKLARLLLYLYDHCIAHFAVSNAELAQLMLRREVGAKALLKAVLLAKAYHFAGFPAFAALTCFYDREAYYILLAANSLLRAHLPTFNYQNQLRGPFIFKNRAACGAPGAHCMRVSESPEKRTEEVAQRFYNARDVFKVYMVDDIVVCVQKFRCRLVFRGSDFTFDSQKDKDKIFGPQIDDISLSEVQLLKELARLLFYSFQADLIAFDAVSSDDGLFIVDVNYFTHDSIESGLWVPLWLARRAARAFYNSSGAGNKQLILW